MDDFSILKIDDLTLSKNKNQNNLPSLNFDLAEDFIVTNFAIKGWTMFQKILFAIILAKFKEQYFRDDFNIVKLSYFDILNFLDMETTDENISKLNNIFRVELMEMTRNSFFKAKSKNNREWIAGNIIANVKVSTDEICVEITKSFSKYIITLFLFAVNIEEPVKELTESYFQNQYAYLLYSAFMDKVEEFNEQIEKVVSFSVPDLLSILHLNEDCEKGFLKIDKVLMSAIEEINETELIKVALWDENKKPFSKIRVNRKIEAYAFEVKIYDIASLNEQKQLLRKIMYKVGLI